MVVYAVLLPDDKENGGRRDKRVGQERLPPQGANTCKQALRQFEVPAPALVHLDLERSCLTPTFIHTCQELCPAGVSPRERGLEIHHGLPKWVKTEKTELLAQPGLASSPLSRGRSPLCGRRIQRAQGRKSVERDVTPTPAVAVDYAQEHGLAHKVGDLPAHTLHRLAADPLAFAHHVAVQGAETDIRIVMVPPTDQHGHLGPGRHENRRFQHARVAVVRTVGWALERGQEVGALLVVCPPVVMVLSTVAHDLPKAAFDDRPALQVPRLEVEPHSARIAGPHNGNGQEQQEPVQSAQGRSILRSSAPGRPCGHRKRPALTGMSGAAG